MSELYKELMTSENPDFDKIKEYLESGMTMSDEENQNCLVYAVVQIKAIDKLLRKVFGKGL